MGTSILKPIHPLQRVRFHHRPAFPIGDLVEISMKSHPSTRGPGRPTRRFLLGNRRYRRKTECWGRSLGSAAVTDLVDIQFVWQNGSRDSRRRRRSSMIHICGRHEMEVGGGEKRGGGGDRTGVPALIFDVTDDAGITPVDALGETGQVFIYNGGDLFERVSDDR